jgi:hypothetical protein
MGQPYLCSLYFKSQLQRDSVLADFSQEMGKNRFKNLKMSTANSVAHPYIAPVDLLYVDEVYACAGSKLECDALIACGPPPIKTPEDFKMELLDYV